MLYSSRHIFETKLYSGFQTIILFCVCFSLLACQETERVYVEQVDRPANPLTGQVQTRSFELQAGNTGEIIATGLRLTPIAHIPSPSIEGLTVQATDVLFKEDTLLASYNFRGEPYKGAIQVIDFSDPMNPDF